MMTGMIANARRALSPPVLLSALLFAAFAVSVTSYALEGSGRVRRVLLFPAVETGKLVGEQRFLPRGGTREVAVERLVKEVLLGPESIELGRIAPRSTGIRSVMLRDREVYVDLTADAALDIAQTPLGLGDSIRGLANNIYFNFSRVQRVRIFVNGQVPAIWGDDLENLSYTREMLR